MSYWRLLIIVILVLYCPLFVLADEFRLVPSIAVKEEYNSNILLSTYDVKSDFLTTISPGIEMVDRTDRLDTDLLVRLDRLEYADNRDFSSTNQTYNGKLRYLITPLFSVSAEAGYVRNSNPTLNIETTGIAMAAIPWDHFTSSLSTDYKITEKTVAAVSYTYGRDYFERTGYVDDISHDVNVGFVHDLGQYLPAVKGRINGDYSYYYFANTRIDSVSGTVGFTCQLNEFWNVLVDGGVRHTWSDFSLAQFQLENSGWGWVGKVSLNYNGEYGNGVLSYLRDLTPAYGLGGAAEQNALTLSTQYRVTHELSILLSAGYYTLKSDPTEFSPQVINQRTFHINPGVRYEFSKDVNVEASYEYTMVDYPAVNTEANRNLFTIRLYIQHPFLE